MAKKTRPSKLRLFALAGGIYILFAFPIGLLGGLGIFTFSYGKGASYLSNNPAVCVNCHVMQSYYDSWQNSTHRHVAVCNDCHLSHHPIGKWITKADNGFFHSLAFTLNDFHEPIQIKPRHRLTTQQACVGCHQTVVHQMLVTQPDKEPLLCVQCHHAAGHALR